MRSVWAAAFLMRRLRAEAGVVLLIAALVGITSFLFAGAPRLFNLVADQGLRREMADAPPAAANLELSRQFVVPSFDDQLAVVERQGTAYLERFPGSIRSLVVGQTLVATSARFAIAEPPRFTTFVSLRHQDGIDEAVTIVAGRLPAGTGERLPSAAPGTPGPGDPPGEGPPRLEIAVSDVTAGAIGVAVGDTLAGTVDETDPLVPQALPRPLEARLEVVGVFTIADPADDVWYGDYRLLEPGIRGSVDDPIAFATALIAPDAYADVASSELPLRHEWRYFVAPDRVDAGQLDTLLPDLRRLASQYGTLSVGPVVTDRIVLRSGLPGVIDRYLAERAASEAVLSIAAIGPVALAAGAIAMSAVLLVARRRAKLLLARDRGASGALLLGAQLWEAALIAGFGALAGLVLAVTFVPGRESGLSTLLALATGLGAAAVLVGATLPVVRGAPEHAGRDEPPPIRTSPRRLVLELTAVGIAVAGVLLLQQRGLTIGGTTTGRVVRFDPFLAAVPLLTGLAVAIIATRLYPLPVRILGWLAARRRDLVPVLGLRNVGRRRSFATLPLLILMLTAAFGSFAAVVMASIDRGQVDASWAGVGADYRIEAEDGSVAAVDVSEVAGVEVAAAGFVDPDAHYESAPNQGARIRLHAVDPAAYLAVTAGSRVGPAWPRAFLAGPDGAAGSAEAPLPAIVSQAQPAGSRPLRVGATFPITVGNGDFTFQVVEVRTSFPGIAPGVPFVVAPFDALHAAVLETSPGRALEPNLLLVRGGEEVAAALSDHVDRTAPSAEVTSRHAWYAGLREAPLIAVVGDGFRLALVVAGAYAALAVLAALVLTAAHRAQDLAFLRTLGLSGGQAVGVTIVEHGTPVVVALVPGILTGIAIADLLEPSLGLGAFIGPEVPFRIHVDWQGITVVAVSLMIVVTVAIGASTWLARRTRAVDALRVGET